MATAMGPSKPIAPSSTGFIPTNYGALSTLVLVFFFWGFIASGIVYSSLFANIIFILTNFKAS
jgi:hypothetical protein